MLLTGPSRAGKTTVCRAVLERARECGLDVAGVLTEDETAPDGSRLQVAHDLATGERRLLARARSVEHVTPPRTTPSGRSHGGGPRLGWTFDPQGVALGRRALEHAMAQGAGLLVIDQIGPRELIEDAGWTVAFDVLSRGHFDLALVVVNPRVLDRATGRLPGCTVVAVDADTRDGLPAEILARYTPS